MRAKSLILAGLLAGCAFFLTGCLMAQYCELGPESHFVYPNSNVKVLGPVRVEQAKWGGVLIPPSAHTSDLDVALYNMALAKHANANLIIDYGKIIKVYSALILPIYWYKLTLEGTAARAEVGKQELR